MILAFAHAGIVVPDLDAARRFYADMFGFSVVVEESWKDSPVVDEIIGSSGSAARTLMLAGHNCYLELFEYTAPAQGGARPGSLGSHEQGIRHLAFYVDDCESEFQRLLSLGGQVLGNPREGVVYCRDPFGNIIELCEIPDNREDPRDLPGLAGLAGS